MRRLSTFLLVIPLTAALTVPVAAQAQTTTEELLSGMVTEEVEPGVLRVVNDGVRDLSPTDFWRVVAGGDGSIWLAGSGGLIRLGDSEVPDPLVDEPYELADLEVTQEGTAWAIVRSDGWPSQLLSFDGDAWTAHSVVDPFWKDQLYSDIEVAPSGRVWAVSSDDPILSSSMTLGYPSSDTRLGYLEADGSRWQTIELPQGEFWLDFDTKGFTATDLGLWAQSQDGFSHYADGEWASIAYEGGDPELPPDGVLWGFGWEGDTGDQVLYRYDGTGWGRWSLEEQGMRPSWGINAFEYGIAPDGGIWATWDGHRGISRFDGEEWVRLLPETSITDFFDISPDGAVWLTARDRQEPDGTPSLYVITPEAVAGTE